MKTEDVIILGAGASKSEGAPVQNQLFEEFFRNYDNSRERKGWENIIIEFFRDFWGIDSANFHRQDVIYPTFEECLGVLDLAYLRRESFKGYTEEKINMARNALVFLIAKILDEKLKGEVKYHKELVNRLKIEGRLKQTVFISLNYDIIIDNVLTKLHPEFCLDYGIEFANFERNDEWKRPNKDKSVLLLKLHDSLNWLYCPTCTQMELTPLKKGAIEAFHEAKKCVKCGTPMKPVIVPPTYYKEMSNPYLQEIFLKADKALKMASRIFICGYSLPDADMHVKYLFKRAEMFKEEPADVYVINNHSDKTEEQKSKKGNEFYDFSKTKREFTIRISPLKNLLKTVLIISKIQ